MKNKPQKNLTPLQKKRVVRLTVLLVVVAFIWLIFAPDMGVYSVMRERSRLQKLQSEIDDLKKQNSHLVQKIERIQTDEVYLEQVAREKYDLLREDEVVFDFSSPKKKKETK